MPHKPVQTHKYLSHKKITFDEKNVILTNHPTVKDYGFMVIPESKTPFPRNADPVDANELHNRLQETLYRARNNNIQIQTHGMTVSESTISDTCDKDAENRKERFYRKRKQFDQSEYIIAKQKIMSSEICEPGASVGNNWRILDDTQHIKLASIHSILNSLINLHCVPGEFPYDKRATFLEIAEQINRTSQPETKKIKKKKYSTK